jgi:hypothetical protein
VIEVTVESTGDHWTVRRAGAEWHYHHESEALAERLRGLPDDARPEGWRSWGADLLYDREAR